MVYCCTTKTTDISVPKTLLASIEDFKAAADSATGSLYGGLRSGICNVWCKFPEWAVQGLIHTFPGNLGGRDAGLGLQVPGISRLCDGKCTTPNARGPYSPDNPSHQEGGRCASVRYVRFSGFATYKSGNGTVRSALYENILLASGFDFGPLTPQTPPRDFGSSSDIIATIFGFNSAGSGPNEATYNMTRTNDGGTFGSDNGWFLQGWSYSFQRFDGQPDTCGNGPPLYPTPSPSDLRFNLTINNTQNNINILIQPNPLNIPVILTPVYPDVFMPIYINFGGERLYFDFDGLSIFSPTINVDINNLVPPDKDTDPPTQTPTTPPVGVPPGDYPTTRKVPPIEPTPEPAPCEPCELVTTQDWQYLRVSATFTNYSDKVIFDDSTNTSIYFAGYVRWTIGGVASGREEPIRRSPSLFRFPIGVDGYQLSALHGSILSATIVSVEEELPEVQYKCQEA